MSFTTLKRMLAFFTLLGTLVLVNGCQKKLDVANPNAIAAENFWKNEADALAGLYGVFDAYQVGELAGNRYMETDHLTDNATTVNSNGWADLEYGNALTNNVRVTERWKAYYTIIHRANEVIQKVGAMPAEALPDANRRRILAEAKFLRAYAYHDLTTQWGDLPFYTEPVGPFQDGAPRTAKADIYAAMIAQLKEEVLPDLPLTVSPSEKGRITADAAKAVLGKYYLYAQDWASAASILKEIIEGGRYQLHPNYEELFTLAGEYSKENLWEINFETGGIDNGESFSKRIDTTVTPVRPKNYWKPTDNLVSSYLAVDGKPIANSTLYGSASPFYIPANASTGRFNNRDPRLKATVFTAADVTPSGKPLWNFITKGAAEFSNTGNYAIKKYYMITATQYNGGPQNYYMIRYADVLLMYAEAQNELAGPDNSVYAAVNAIRRRLVISENLAGGKGTLSGSATSVPAGAGITFDLTSSILLKKVNINVAANQSGPVTVTLQNAAGETQNTATIKVPSASGTAQRVITIPLYFIINAGTGYKLLLSTALPIAREATASYPYTLFGAGALSGPFPATPGGYNYFYHWQYDILNSNMHMPDYPPGLTQAQMRDYIRDERRWEFGLEHSRYFDLKRWKIADVVVPASLSAKKFEAPRDYLWPYPQEEMDNNAAMKAEGQNPGW